MPKVLRGTARTRIAPFTARFTLSIYMPRIPRVNISHTRVACVTRENFYVLLPLPLSSRLCRFIVLPFLVILAEFSFLFSFLFSRAREIGKPPAIDQRRTQRFTIFHRRYARVRRPADAPRSLHDEHLLICVRATPRAEGA